MLQSLYSMNCLLYTAHKVVHTYIGRKNLQIDFQNATFFTVDSSTDIEWQFIKMFGCIVRCPDSGGGFVAPELNCNFRRKTDWTLRAIPSKYVIFQDDYEENSDSQFPFELLKVSASFDSIADGTVALDDSTSHCIDSSVTTTSPATYEIGLYRCCFNKQLVEIISESYAFASFLLVLAVFCTTPTFYHFQHRSVDPITESGYRMHPDGGQHN